MLGTGNDFVVMTNWQINTHESCDRIIFDILNKCALSFYLDLNFSWDRFKYFPVINGDIQAHGFEKLNIHNYFLVFFYFP